MKNKPFCSKIITPEPSKADPGIFFKGNVVRSAPGEVVLVTCGPEIPESFSGTVIYAEPDSQHTIGYHSEDWATCQFFQYTGEVHLAPQP